MENVATFVQNGKLIHSEELKSEFYKLLQPHFSSENDSNENVKER